MTCPLCGHHLTPGDACEFPGCGYIPRDLGPPPKPSKIPRVSPEPALALSDEDVETGLRGVAMARKALEEARR